MNVQVKENDWLRIVGCEITEFVPTHVLGELITVGKVWTPESEDFVDLIDGLRRYISMFPDNIIKIEVIHGHGSRLIGGPEGFTTDWKVFDTPTQAQADLAEYFE